MICAGSTSGLRYNAARGDSGGPLVIEDDNQYYLAGIVSWGDPNDMDFKLARPAAFARVSAVENWFLVW
jgi:secreted trypsin-like serine protease